MLRPRRVRGGERRRDRCTLDKGRNLSGNDGEHVHHFDGDDYRSLTRPSEHNRGRRSGDNYHRGHDDLTGSDLLLDGHIGPTGRLHVDFVVDHHHDIGDINEHNHHDNDNDNDNGAHDHNNPVGWLD